MICEVFSQNKTEISGATCEGRENLEGAVCKDSRFSRSRSTKCSDREVISHFAHKSRSKSIHQRADTKKSSI